MELIRLVARVQRAVETAGDDVVLALQQQTVGGVEKDEAVAMFYLGSQFFDGGQNVLFAGLFIDQGGQMNVGRLIDGSGLVCQLGDEVPGVLGRILQIDGSVAIPVNADGQDIQMWLIGRSGGDETGCTHHTLHGVGSVEGGQADLVFAGNRFQFHAFVNQLALGPRNVLRRDSASP